MLGPFNRLPFNRAPTTEITGSAVLSAQSTVLARGNVLYTVSASLETTSTVIIVSGRLHYESVELSAASSSAAKAFRQRLPHAELNGTGRLSARGVSQLFLQAFLHAEGHVDEFTRAVKNHVLGLRMDATSALEAKAGFSYAIDSVLLAQGILHASAAYPVVEQINQPRYIRSPFGFALMVEEGTTNLIPSTLAWELTTSWTSPSLSGTYTLSVRDGMGAVQVSGGYNGLVQPGTFVTFSLTNATITLTPVGGTPRLVQLEAKSYPTSFIDGVREPEVVKISTEGFVSAAQGTIDVWKKEGNEWALFTTVWQGTSAKRYRNKVLIEELTDYQAPVTELVLEYGIYDEIRFSSVARTEEEIAAYDLTLPLPTDDKTSVKYDFNRRLEPAIGHPFTTILGDLNVTGPLPFNITLGPHGIMAVDRDGRHTFSIDGEGNALFAGELVAASGTFVGELQAATGSFAGEITATSAYFTGTVHAQNATLTGRFLAPNATLEQITVDRAVILNADIQNANITGRLNGVDGTFTGSLVGVDGTFTGTLVGVNGTFVGTLYAAVLETCRVLGENNRLLFGPGSSPNQFDGRIDYSPLVGNGRMRFQVSNTEYIAVDRTRQFWFVTRGYGGMGLVETDSNPHFGLVLGQVMVKGLDSLPGQVQIRNRGDGVYRDIAASDFITASRREFKEDIRELEESALDIISRTKVYSFRFKDCPERKMGLIYQEVPDILKQGEEAISIQSQIALLWKAVQELNAKLSAKSYKS